MKLSSKVLAGSLASAGMVLSLVAPALTAQAAQTSATVGTDGTVTGNTVADGKYALSSTDKSLPNGGLAIAYDNGKTTDVGSATAESNANVKVINGLLVLDQVPDFGFGTAALGSTVNLNNNKYDDQATDSENASAVKVIESRQNQPGFTLGAQMTAFKSGSDSQAFVMTLNPTDLVDDNGDNVSTVTGTSLKTDEAQITAGTTSDTTIADLAKGSYKNGTISADYSKATSAKLNLVTNPASNGGDPSKASVKSYNSTITWTLTAKPTTVA
ncbi:WxL domain-containing protein [Companilactobacillus nuruki]|nr:WxL domain-containing protein [Companilactobacillus nuruki]